MVSSRSISGAPSLLSESRLPDRLGGSAEYSTPELLAEMEIAGVVVLASKTASQQKVPLFHNRQLKFSNLRPSSIDEADRETANMLIFVCGPSSKKDAHPSTI